MTTIEAIMERLDSHGINYTQRQLDDLSFLGDEGYQRIIVTLLPSDVTTFEDAWQFWKKCGILNVEEPHVSHREKLPIFVLGTRRWIGFTEDGEHLAYHAVVHDNVEGLHSLSYLRQMARFFRSSNDAGDKRASLLVWAAVCDVTARDSDFEKVLRFYSRAFNAFVSEVAAVLGIPCTLTYQEICHMFKPCGSYPVMRNEWISSVCQVTGQLNWICARDTIFARFKPRPDTNVQGLRFDIPRFTAVDHEVMIHNPEYPKAKRYDYVMIVLLFLQLMGFRHVDDFMYGNVTWRKFPSYETTTIYDNFKQLFSVKPYVRIRNWITMEPAEKMFLPN